MRRPGRGVLAVTALAALALGLELSGGAQGRGDEGARRGARAAGTRGPSMTVPSRPSSAPDQVDPGFLIHFPDARVLDPGFSLPAPDIDRIDPGFWPSRPRPKGA